MIFFIFDISHKSRVHRASKKKKNNNKKGRKQSILQMSIIICVALLLLLSLLSLLLRCSPRPSPLRTILHPVIFVPLMRAQIIHPFVRETAFGIRTNKWSFVGMRCIMFFHSGFTTELFIAELAFKWSLVLWLVGDLLVCFV